MFSNAALQNETHFVEVARPQVHGHSMQCMATVSPFVSNFFLEYFYDLFHLRHCRSIIVTGAEEKIFRAFEAPLTFVKSVCNIGGFEVKEVFILFATSECRQFICCWQFGCHGIFVQFFPLLLLLQKLAGKGVAYRISKSFSPRSTQWCIRPDVVSHA